MERLFIILNCCLFLTTLITTELSATEVAAGKEAKAKSLYERLIDPAQEHAQKILRKTNYHENV